MSHLSGKQPKKKKKKKKGSNFFMSLDNTVFLLLVFQSKETVAVIPHWRSFCFPTWLPKNCLIHHFKYPHIHSPQEIAHLYIYSHMCVCVNISYMFCLHDHTIQKWCYHYYVNFFVPHTIVTGTGRWNNNISIFIITWNMPCMYTGLLAICRLNQLYNC